VKLFRGFAVASAVLAFVIAVLGSWVRINGAGLTCPDWPLCHGQLVPSLAGGVVLEWSHRLVAFVEGFVLIGAIVTGIRVRRRIAGVTPTLVALGAIFLIQVSLGGATVLLSNSPVSVVLHWGMAMALLGALTVLATLATLAPVSGLAEHRFTGSSAPAFSIVAGFAFVTMCVGAYVSSSYAGLACPSFPLCHGTMWGVGVSQNVQMLHRIAAVSFAVVAAFTTAATFSMASRRVRACATAGLILIALQIGLGVGNVLWRLPTGLREAHAANAGLTFLAFVLAATLAALEPYRAAAAARGSLAARSIATNT